MQPNIFDRVFTYPASQFVLPSENLATEITAYLLESWPEFREHFLDGIGVKEAGLEWTIETQRRLYAPGKPWDKKIPDLLIRNASRKILVAVEVKVDAGVTFSEGVPQSLLYRDYLESERSQGSIDKWQMVLLTRWSPGALLVDGATSIRFSDIANWLIASIHESTISDRHVRFLGEQWLLFLQKRRWALTNITELHVKSIKPMSELLARLWDELSAAREAALSDPSGGWTIAANTKTSDQSWENGIAIWDRGMKSTLEQRGVAQFGYYYGEEAGQPVLCPLLWFNALLQLTNSSSLQSKVRDFDSNSYYVKFANIAPAILHSPGSNRPWDDSRDALHQTLMQLRPTSSINSAPETGSGTFIA